MMQKTPIAIVGYGNIGRFAAETLKSTPDMELAGVVRRTSSLNEPKPPELRNVPVVDNIARLDGVKAALLCIPTRSVPEYAREMLQMGINTVDSYDIHGQLAGLRRDLDAVAKAHDSVAVVSAGWDPGTDSMVRCMFEFMSPRGITYTNFGPGMSMGHSVAVKAVPGVENALSMTIPLGTGVHRRMVYVQAAPGHDFAVIEQTIKNDPYFIKDETYVFQVTNVEELIDMGHGVEMERKGVSGQTHNQMLKLSMRINNPALTAQIMVASARATFRQSPGAYTMIQIPIIDYMFGDQEDIINRFI